MVTAESFEVGGALHREAHLGVEPALLVGDVLGVRVVLRIELGVRLAGADVPDLRGRGIAVLHPLAHRERSVAQDSVARDLEAGDAALRARMAELVSSPERCAEMGRRARETAQARKEEGHANESGNGAQRQFRRRR